MQAPVANADHGISGAPFCHHQRITSSHIPQDGHILGYIPQLSLTLFASLIPHPHCQTPEAKESRWYFGGKKWPNYLSGKPRSCYPPLHAIHSRSCTTRWNPMEKELKIPESCSGEHQTTHVSQLALPSLLSLLLLLFLSISFSVKQSYSPALKLSQCEGLAQQTPSELNVFRLTLIHLRPPAHLSLSLSLPHPPSFSNTHFQTDTHMAPLQTILLHTLSHSHTYIHNYDVTKEIKWWARMWIWGWMRFSR